MSFFFALPDTFLKVASGEKIDYICKMFQKEFIYIDSIQNQEKRVLPHNTSWSFHQF